MSQLQRQIDVLLIEDNADDARLVGLYLDRAEHDEFRLERVDRLEAGIARLAAGAIDVVLLDLTLPDSQGFDTFQRLSLAAPRVPIVVMTGIDDATLASRAVRDGAQDYLLKRDVSTELLVRSIRYSLERKHFEEKLRESEERYALAVSGANDGIWDWNLETEEIYLSPRWKEMLGYEVDEVTSSSSEWFDRVHPEDLEQLRRDIGAHVSGRTRHFGNEHRLRHSDGRYIWMLSRGIAMRESSNKPHRMAGSLTDIHGRKMTEEQLLHDAMHDALTDLPNRALFMDRLGVAVAQSVRHADHRFAVLFFDVDRFKNVNDSLGHAIGDQLLLAIARRLQQFVRPDDTLARLGGDEFAILLNAVEDPSHATRVAERVHTELGRPFDLQGHEVFTSASIGIALSSGKHKRPEELLRDADTAMYRAKSLGKARHAIFDQDMHRRAVELLQLENDLRRAVDRHEFHLHYQPIVFLETGRLEGFEALVRWEHPDKGLIYPADFIPLAEETGLIVPIGLSVLREACAQMAVWSQKHRYRASVPVSVNLSSRQFAQPDFLEQLEAILEDTAIAPSSLRLEITESMVMEDAEAAIEKLRQLREIGVLLHIDDFGTGYSSLSYLHRLPTHTLKIDGSFVRHMHEDNGGAQIVGTIVNLARSLGMRVAAEGLETANQLATLRQLQCELGQGFYFSRPVDGEAADDLLSSQARW